MKYEVAWKAYGIRTVEAESPEAAELVVSDWFSEDVDIDWDGVDTEVIGDYS